MYYSLNSATTYTTIHRHVTPCVYNWMEQPDTSPYTSSNSMVTTYHTPIYFRYSICHTTTLLTVNILLISTTKWHTTSLCTLWHSLSAMYSKSRGPIVPLTSLSYTSLSITNVINAALTHVSSFCMTSLSQKSHPK